MITTMRTNYIIIGGGSDGEGICVYLSIYLWRVVIINPIH